MSTIVHDLHVPPADEAQAIEALARGALPSSAWTPFGPPDLRLWLGPRLSIALRSTRGRWRVAPPAEARELLRTHGFGVPTGLQNALSRALDDAPLGTPIDDAVARVARELSGFTVVDQPERSTTLLMRAGEPIVALVAGKYRELEFAGWVRGDEALDLQSAHVDALPRTAPADTLLVAVEPSESRTALRAVLLALGGLVAGPLVAAPLLLIDAVLWVIGIGLVWAVSIALGPRLLRRRARTTAEPMLRVDPWRVWLPAELGPSPVDRSVVTATLRQRAAFGTATTGFAYRAPSVRNLAMTYLTITGPGLDLTIGCEGAPPEERAVPLVAPGWSAARFAQVSPRALRLVATAVNATNAPATG